MKQFYRESVWWMLAIMAPVSAVAQGICPTNLDCESKSNPLGRSGTSPQLGWQDVAAATRFFRLMAQ